MKVIRSHLFGRYVSGGVISPTTHAELGILAKEYVLVVHRLALAYRISNISLPVRGVEIALEEPRFVNHTRRVVRWYDRINVQPRSISIYHHVRIPICIYARSTAEPIVQ